jgi:hypothetical protein
MIYLSILTRRFVLNKLLGLGLDRLRGLLCSHAVQKIRCWESKNSINVTLWKDDTVKDS